jgi:hypothetical protein
MDIPTCPRCAANAVRWLDISKDAWVDYLRCDACQHTWNIPQFRAVNVGRVGHVTYEGKFVIIPVPVDWSVPDPLPPPSPDDLWFNGLVEFERELDGPWDHKPINRRPWEEAPAAPLVGSLNNGRSGPR